MLKKIKNMVSAFFRKIPITFKVTIWYTSFIVTLLVVIISGSFFAVNEFSDRVSKRDLVEIVNKKTKHKDKFDVFDEGVYFVLYDDKNQVIQGLLPGEISITEKSFDKVSEYVNGEKSYIYYDKKISSSNGYIRGIVDLSASKKDLRFIPLVFLVLSPIIIFIIIYGGYLIIKRALAPIKIISNTAQNIENSGDLTKRIELPSGKDEVYSLAKVLNNMLDSLEKSSEREKKFSSDVSHELRTPVSVISAESEYALKYNDNVDDYKKSFEVVKRQTSRMTKMINQILEISRIDQLENINVESQNISTLLNNMLKDYNAMLLENSIKTVINIEENIVAEINKDLFSRAIDNIFLNAVKFTNDTIVINLYQKDNEIIFECQDNGEGIPESELENIWLRFYKVDKARTKTDNESSGLGLAIAKKIVELHNGKIYVENLLSGGASFKIKFKK